MYRPGPVKRECAGDAWRVQLPLPQQRSYLPQLFPVWVDEDQAQRRPQARHPSQLAGVGGRGGRGVGGSCARRDVLPLAAGRQAEARHQ